MSTLIIGAAAVIRTLAVVAVGSFSATLLENVGSSNSWFSIMNVYLFLPCLLFGHFSTGFSVEVFQEGIPLVIFGFCRMFIGVATTKIAGMIGWLDEETQPLTLLATSSSNAVAIPLSMLEELSSRVDFLTSDPQFQVRDAQSGKLITAQAYCVTLMFVFAIPINFAIWSFGQFFIRSAAEKKHEQEKQLKEQQHQKLEQELEGRRGQTLQSVRISVGHDLSASTEIAAAAQDQNNSSGFTNRIPPNEEEPNSKNESQNNQDQQQQQHQQPPLQAEYVTPSSITATPMAPNTEESGVAYIFRVYIVRSLSVPLVASLGGIVVSLIPGVRFGITGGWPILTSFSNCVLLLGEAAVPAALLTVGITVFKTLTAKPKKEEATSTTVQITVTNTNEHQSSTPDASTMSSPPEPPSSTLAQKITKLLGIDASLLVVTSLVQLVVTPIIAFLAIRFFFFRSDFEMIQNSASNGIFEHEDAEYWRRRRLMLFSLLSETMCPSAMNTSIICTLYNYRSDDFSRMIVYQYILSVFTMSILMSVFLSSLQP